MSSITFTDIKILDSVFPGVAIIFTAVRIALRVHSARIWWDDALSLLSSLFLVVTSVATGMHYGGPYSYSLVTRLAAYYLIAEGFYATLWTARLAILFSVIRIVPEKGQKRFLYSTAIAFFLVLVFLLAQVFWVCEALVPQKWKAAPNPQCSLGLQVAVCQLITDIFSDALLIAVPVRLLMRTHLEPALKIRLLIIFSAALLTTVVSLVHAAYILEVRGINAIISAVVEVSVAVIVCNLVVVVPALSRTCGSRAQEDPHRVEPSFRASSFRFANRFGRTEGTVAETGMGTGFLGATSFAGEAGAMEEGTATASGDGVSGGEQQVQEGQKENGRRLSLRWERSE